MTLGKRIRGGGWGILSWAQAPCEFWKARLSIVKAERHLPARSEQPCFILLSPLPNPKWLVFWSLSLKNKKSRYFLLRNLPKIITLFFLISKERKRKWESKEKIRDSLKRLISDPTFELGRPPGRRGQLPPPLALLQWSSPGGLSPDPFFLAECKVSAQLGACLNMGSQTLSLGNQGFRVRKNKKQDLCHLST